MRQNELKSRKNANWTENRIAAEELKNESVQLETSISRKLIKPQFNVNMLMYLIDFEH